MKCTFMVMLGAVVLVTSAYGVDYKKSTVSGTSSNTSTYISFSSKSTMSGDGAVSAGSFGSMDWDDFGLKKKTIDERIKSAEAKLNRLYFIRDVCPKLESEIKIAFEKKDIRDVVKQLGEVMETKLPCEVPEGRFVVEKSEVVGMPADQFLNTIAGVCGLELTYARDKLVFKKTEKKAE